MIDPVMLEQLQETYYHLLYRLIKIICCKMSLLQPATTIFHMQEHPQGASTTGCTLARNRLLPALACLQMTWQCDPSDIEENEMTGQF